MAISELLTTAKAAQRCGLSSRTLEAWRSRGKGPPYHRLGGAIRYDSVDLEQWIAKARHPGARAGGHRGGAA